jgi:hypothetical protein
MLLLYRVEAYDANNRQWFTLKICRPPYRKTETYRIEKWGFLKLRKRRVVDNCVIHNEKSAVEIAFDEALQYAYENRKARPVMRIQSEVRVDGTLITATARGWGTLGGNHVQHSSSLRDRDR